MRGFLQLIFLAIITSCLSACHEDSNSLTIPDDLDKDFSLVFSDSTKIATSTVLLDSFPTSYSSNLLLGKYQDPFLGTIEAQPYMEFQMQATKWVPSTFATLDSVKLFLKYSGYYYGDTTVAQNFEVYRLSQGFVSYPIDPFISQEFKYPAYSFLQNFLFLYPAQYNTSSFTTESSPIGTFSVKPLPTSRNIGDKEHFQLGIKLSNSLLGDKMLDQAKNPNGAFSTPSNFYQFFKGLTIKSISGPGAVFGLQADSVGSDRNSYSRAKIKIYYKDGGIQKVFILPIYLGLNNFNHITADRSGTPLENLKSTNREISSEQTDGKTFIQAGTGILTKVRFPHLKSILGLPGFLKLNSAKLVLEPVENSYTGKNYLPSSLELFEGDGRNVPFAEVQADYDSRHTQITPVIINPIDGRIVGYTFSLTQYTQSLLDGETDPKDFALFLSLPNSQWGSSVNRAVINTSDLSNFRLRLEIYYLRRNE
jgi:hypothetical protein